MCCVGTGLPTSSLLCPPLPASQSTRFSVPAGGVNTAPTAAPQAPTGLSDLYVGRRTHGHTHQGVCVCVQTHPWDHCCLRRTDQETVQRFAPGHTCSKNSTQRANLAFALILWAPGPRLGAHKFKASRGMHLEWARPELLPQRKRTNLGKQETHLPQQYDHL